MVLKQHDCLMAKTKRVSALKIPRNEQRWPRFARLAKKKITHNGQNFGQKAPGWGCSFAALGGVKFKPSILA
jgi:hypothetical protein